MNCFSSKAEDYSSHLRNTSYQTLSFSGEIILHFFLTNWWECQIPTGRRICGSHPKLPFRASSFEGCSFLILWKWREIGVLHGLVLSETFLAGLLEIGWKIVIYLMDLDCGPFLRKLKAELWNQLIPCSAKALEAQRKHVPVHYGSQASFFNYKVKKKSEKDKTRC